MTQKTLMLTTPYFPPYGGGLERYAFEIAKRLISEHGWKVFVVTSGTYKGTEDTKEVVDGITVYRLAYELRLSNTPFSFSWRKKIREIIENEKPDYLNVHMPVPGIGDVAASLVSADKLIITYHAGTMKKGKFPVDLLIAIYEDIFLKFLFAKAHRIVCSSDYVRKQFLKRKYRDKVLTITPAADTSLFKPIAKIFPHPKDILFVAGFTKAHKHKGLKTLIQAMSQVDDVIPEVTLTMVGSGDLQPQYLAYAKGLGIRSESMRFKGRLEGQALASVYQETGVVVLPSYAPAESFGMVLIEGMACKKPVIGTNIGGIPEVVKEGENGFLVPPADPTALAQAIKKILGDDALADRFGEHGYQMVIEKFIWDIQAEKYNTLFESLA